jgi:hypothetical protein
VVGVVFLVITLALAAWGLSVLRSLEPPGETVQRHWRDHRRWWRSEIAGVLPRLLPSVGRFTPLTGLWVIETAAGKRRFVKAASNDDTARFLRQEMVAYHHVQAAFMPEVEAFIDDGERPFLIIEDLSGFHWPPPWSADHVEAVLRVCDAIAATPPPPGLSDEVERTLSEPFWSRIDTQAEPVHDLGVASAAWFDSAMPALIDAEAGAVIGGEALVHADIRSDNVCISGQVKVVDWNWAFVGNPMLDPVGWLPSLFLEGGPPPWELLTGEVGLVTKVAGFFLDHATKPRSPEVREDIREFQRAQGEVALQWAAHELGLVPPAESLPT